VSALTSLVGLVRRRVHRRPSNSSSDPAFRKFILESDPLQSPVVSVRWLQALKKWIKQFLLQAPCQHAPLVVQGKKDSTVDWLYNIAVIKVKFPNVTVAYIEDARHHLANETQAIRKALYQHIDRYLQE
jgi:alpha-beta hydrolase superfamily lysophospholipase